MKNSTYKMIIGGFAAIIVLAIGIFLWLTSYMERLNSKGVTDVGRIYMKEMNEQMKIHYTTIIEERFSQVEEILHRIQKDKAVTAWEVKDDMFESAQMQELEFLGMYAEDGTCQVIYGDAVELDDSDMFFATIAAGERCVTAGKNSTEDLTIYGTPAELPMKNGKTSMAVVSGRKLSVLNEMLALDVNNSLVYSHIIRPDGSYVLRNADSHLNTYYERIMAYGTPENMSNGELVELLQDCIINDEDFSATVRFDYSYQGNEVHENRQLYGTSLPYADWYLITVMPNGSLDQNVEAMGSKRTRASVFAFLVLASGIIVLFAVLFRMLQKQLRTQEEQLAVIAGLGSEYYSVMLVDYKKDKVQIHRAQNADGKQIGDFFAGYETWSEGAKAYADTQVVDNKEAFYAAFSREGIMSHTDDYSFDYKKLIDEEYRYLQVRVAYVDIVKGYKVAIVGTKDIDEAVRKEIEQRTLIEDALVRAENANKAKSIFLSNMSHDIRTPMNAIIGFTALATAHIENTEMVRDYLGKIASSSNHLLSLINDVLDMSRIESGRIYLEETECNLSDIMHELRDILVSDLKSRNLNLFIDTVDVYDERVICDKLRLNQILLNLLGNAMKFTEPGGNISVRIFEKPDEAKDYAKYEFHVKDTGIGMSEEFQKHIFEPFERERTSTVSGIQGTGLGLSITKNIVEMMGGTISVTSKKGEGTEFVVQIPMRKAVQDEMDIKIPELEGIHALVVDDDFNTCDSVSNMLMQIGMRAEWTMSGKEAVLRCRQSIQRSDPYKVYIIDWLMPDLNGIEVARQIRKEAGEDTPIIILTSYDWGEVEEEARAAGVTAFVGKPLFISDIRRCLMDVLHPQKEEEEQKVKARDFIAGQRVLLVEDNDLNREIATAILSEAGILVEEVEDGSIAVDKLLEKGAGYYSLVLMDVQMPVMDGYTATQRIRAFDDKELADIPIIAMTANAFEEDKQKAMEMGMNAHIAKPIDVEKLFDTLEEIIFSKKG